MFRKSKKYLAFLLATMMLVTSVPVDTLAATITTDTETVVDTETTETETQEDSATETPEVTDPEATDPEVTDPEATDPEVTDPEVTDSEATDPEVTDPEVTDSEVMDQETTDSEVTEEIVEEIVVAAPVQEAAAETTEETTSFINVAPLATIAATATNGATTTNSTNLVDDNYSTLYGFQSQSFSTDDPPSVDLTLDATYTVSSLEVAFENAGATDSNGIQFTFQVYGKSSADAEWEALFEEAQTADRTSEGCVKTLTLTEAKSLAAVRVQITNIEKTAGDPWAALAELKVMAPMSQVEAITAERATAPADGTVVINDSNNWPFPSSEALGLIEEGTDDTLNNVHYRIPALITTASGKIMAAADMRWGNHANPDDAANIDTIVSISEDNGVNWKYSLANYIADNGNVRDLEASTIIDPALVEYVDADTKASTIYMMADLFPGQVSTSTANCSNVAKTDTGFVEIDGEYYLKLRGNANAAATTCPYYLKYTTTDGTKVGKVYRVSDNTEVSGYTVDEYFNLSKEGILLGNLFTYSKLYFQPIMTTYLYLTSSTDDGESWSAPRLLPLKTSDDGRFLVVSPGHGLQTQNNHIVFHAYNTSTKHFLFYSTDGGTTWQRSEAPSVSTQCTEGDIVELEDGTLRIFYRHAGGDGYLNYVDATWDAANNTYTWGTPVSQGDASIHNDVNLSAVVYSDKVDGNEIILVSAATSGRSKGRLFTYVVDADDNTMTLVNTRTINDSSFSYSSLTVLPDDAGVGLLYENGDAGSISYTTFTEEQVLENTTITDVETPIVTYVGESVAFPTGDVTGELSVQVNGIAAVTEGAGMETTPATAITSGEQYVVVNKNSQMYLTNSYWRNESDVVKGFVLNADEYTVWTIEDSVTSENEYRMHSYETETSTKAERYLYVTNGGINSSVDPNDITLTYYADGAYWHIIDGSTYYLSQYEEGSTRAAGAGTATELSQWELHELIDGFTVTGVSEGTIKVLVGTTRYTVNVLPERQKNVTIKVGETQKFAYTDATAEVTNDSTIVTTATTTVAAGTAVDSIVSGGTYLLQGAMKSLHLTNVASGNYLTASAYTAGETKFNWTVEVMEDGYSLQSADGRYLSTISNNHATLSSAQTALTLAYWDSYWTIAQGSIYLGQHNTASNVAGWTGDGAFDRATSNSHWLLKTAEAQNVISFTGVTVGTTDVKVGDFTYHVTVEAAEAEAEPIDVTLKIGDTYSFVYNGAAEPQFAGDTSAVTYTDEKQLSTAKATELISGGTYKLLCSGGSVYLLNRSTSYLDGSTYRYCLSLGTQGTDWTVTATDTEGVYTLQDSAGAYLTLPSDANFRGDISLTEATLTIAKYSTSTDLWNVYNGTRYLQNFTVNTNATVGTHTNTGSVNSRWYFYPSEDIHEVALTAEQSGVVTVTAGDTVYNVTVEADEEITLKVGETKKIKLSDTAAEITINDETITSTETDTIAAGEAVDAIFSGETYRIEGAKQDLYLTNTANDTYLTASAYTEGDTQFDWIIEAMEDGYSLKDANGQYLSTISSNHATLSDTQTALALTYWDSYWTVAQGSIYLGQHGTATNVAGWTGSGAFDRAKSNSHWMIKAAEAHDVLCFTGTAVGVTDVKVGDVVYRVTVEEETEKEQIDVTLHVGDTYEFAYNGTEDPEIESEAAAITEAHTTQPKGTAVTELLFGGAYKIKNVNEAVYLLNRATDHYYETETESAYLYCLSLGAEGVDWTVAKTNTAGVYRLQDSEGAYLTLPTNANYRADISLTDATVTIAQVSGDTDAWTISNGGRYLQNLSAGSGQVGTSNGTASDLRYWEFYPSEDIYDVTLTAASVGTATVTAGDAVYNVTVIPREEVTVDLYIGQTKKLVQNGTAAENPVFAEDTQYTEVTTRTTEEGSAITSLISGGNYRLYSTNDGRYLTNERYGSTTGLLMDNDGIVWTITADGQDGFAVQDENGAYLNPGTTNGNATVDTEAVSMQVRPYGSYYWTLGNASGYYLNNYGGTDGRAGSYIGSRTDTGSRWKVYAANDIQEIYFTGTEKGTNVVTIGHINYTVNVLGEQPIEVDLQLSETAAFALGDENTYVQVGTLTDASVEDDIAAASVEVAVTAGTEVTTADALVSGGTYTIQSNRYQTKYLTNESHTEGGRQLSTTPTTWTITASGDEYTIQDPAGEYLRLGEGENTATMQVEEATTVIALNSTTWTLSKDEYYLNCYGNSQVRASGWKGTGADTDAGSQWNLLTAEDINAVTFTAKRAGTTTLTVGDVVYDVTVAAIDVETPVILNEESSTTIELLGTYTDVRYEDGAEAYVTAAADADAGTITFTAQDTPGTYYVNVGNYRYTVQVAALTNVEIELYQGETAIEFTHTGAAGTPVVTDLASVLTAVTETEVAENGTFTITTGQTAGTAEIIIGDVRYNVTVLEDKEVSLTLLKNQTLVVAYDGEVRQTTTSTEITDAITAIVSADQGTMIEANTQVSSIASGGSYTIQSVRAGTYLDDEAYSSTTTLKLTSDKDTAWILTSDGTADSYTVQPDTGAGTYLYIAEGVAELVTDPQSTEVWYVGGTGTESDPHKWGITQNGEHLNEFGGGGDNAAGHNGESPNDADGAQWTIETAAEMTPITFTGNAVGTTSVKIGNVTYNIEVIQIPVTVELYEGESTTVSLNGQTAALEYVDEAATYVTASADTTNDEITFTAGTTAGTYSVSVGGYIYNVTVKSYTDKTLTIYKTETLTVTHEGEAGVPIVRDVTTDSTAFTGAVTLANPTAQVADGGTFTITGETVGTLHIIVGSVRYTVKVLAVWEIDVDMYEGQVLTVPQTVGSDATTENDDATVATVATGDVLVASEAEVATLVSGASYTIQNIRAVVDTTRSKTYLSDEPYGTTSTLAFTETPTTDWIIRTVSGGYTIQSDTGKYLKITNGTAVMVDEEQILTLTYNESGAYFTGGAYWTIGQSTNYLNDHGSENDRMANAAGYNVLDDDGADWVIKTASAINEVTLSANAAGTTTARVGNTIYNIAVQEKEIAVELYVGEIKSFTQITEITTPVEGDGAGAVTVETDAAAETVTFTGVTAGQKIITVGDIVYTVNVLGYKVENITLHVGETKIFGQNGTFSTDSTNTDETISYIAETGAVEADINVSEIVSGASYYIKNVRKKAAGIPYLTNEPSSAANPSQGLLLSADAEEWTIRKVDKGYTIQDVDGNYLTFGTATATVQSGEAVLQAGYTAIDGTAPYWDLMKDEIYLNNYGGGARAAGYGEYGADDDGSRWEIVTPTVLTTYSFTGNKVGTNTITVGNTIYNINVVMRKEYVRIKVGESILLDGVTPLGYIDEGDDEYISESYEAGNGEYLTTVSGLKATDGLTADQLPGLAVWDVVFGYEVDYIFTIVSKDTEYPTTNEIVSGSMEEAGEIINELITTTEASYDFNLQDELPEGYTVEWISGNTAVFTVDENGTVYAVSQGSATLTALIKDADGNIVSEDTVEVLVYPGVNPAAGRLISCFTATVKNCTAYYCTQRKVIREIGEGTAVHVYASLAATSDIICFFAVPNEGYALTMLGSESGSYFEVIRDQDDPTIFGSELIVDRETLEINSGSSNASYTYMFDQLVTHAVANGSITVADAAEIVTMATEMELDGGFFYSRGVGAGNIDIGDNTFIANELPTVHKEIESITYQEIDGTWASVPYTEGMVAYVGNIINYKITVSMYEETLGSGQTDGIVYSDFVLVDEMSDDRVAYFRDTTEETLDLTEWANNVDESTPRTEAIDQSYYIDYTITADDLRKEITNKATLTYNYSSVYTEGSFSNSEEMHASITAGSFQPAALVIDYNMPVTVDYTEELAEIDQTMEGTVDAPVTKTSANGATVTITKKVVDGVERTYVTYAPTKILKNFDTFTMDTYFTNADGTVTTATSTCRVVPATTMYYEENFADYGKGWNVTEGGDWTVSEDTAYAAMSQSPDTYRSLIYNYNYDPEYKDDTVGSNNTFAKTTTRADSLKFEFTGTGVDLFANVEEKSPLIIIKITDANGVIKKMMTVDTASTGSYGIGTLAYPEDETAAAAAKAYNTPIASITDLDYGTYTVTICVASDCSRPTRTAGFEFDGFRIYNACVDSSVAWTMYGAHGEADPTYLELRDALLTGFDVINRDDVYDEENGSIYAEDLAKATQVYTSTGSHVAYFINESASAAETIYTVALDDNEYDLATVSGEEQLAQESEYIKELLDNGPKNEVYVQAGQTVTFAMPEGNSVQIGLRSALGNTEGVTYSYLTTDADGNTVAETKTVTSTVDMFYPLTGVPSADNDGTIVYTVSVGSDQTGILSITDVKVLSSASAEPVFVAMSASDLTYAFMAMGYAAAPIVEEEAVVPETEDTTKETVTTTVTSTEVAKVTETEAVVAVTDTEAAAVAAASTVTGSSKIKTVAGISVYDADTELETASNDETASKVTKPDAAEGSAITETIEIVDEASAMTFLQKIVSTIFSFIEWLMKWLMGLFQ